jgi:hypothetical protein
MEINGFEDKEFVYDLPAEPADWNGRAVRYREVDPRIEFIRQLVTTYFHYMLAGPDKLEAFEQKLLEVLFDDEEDEEIDTLDPLVFIRNLANVEAKLI